MHSVPLTILAGVAVLVASVRLRTLYRNIAAAKASGLHYVIMPFAIIDIVWLLFTPILTPILEQIPLQRTKSWLRLLSFDQYWKNGHEPFRQEGADTFIAVSPTTSTIFTCDPEVINQFLFGPFQKPAELLGLLNVLGPSIVGSNGDEARLYRRITGPSFGDQTMRHVWTTSVEATQALLRVLVPHGYPATCRQLRPYTEKMSLQTLMTVGLGYEPSFEELYRSGDKVPAGHDLSFHDAMNIVLRHLQTLFIMPKPFLRLSPLKSHKEAYQSYCETSKYLEEVAERQRQAIKDGTAKPGNNLLVDHVVEAGESSEKHPKPVLNDSQIRGIIFNYLFAGHEANANTSEFIVLLLACHPTIQRHLQEDIDGILKSTPTEAWSHDKAYIPLMESHVGAVIYETLRLYPVLPLLPKTVGETSQVVKIGQVSHVLPANTMIFINSSATHHNPKYWSDSERNMVTSFQPSRWLNCDNSDQKSSFLHPRPGSYIPFSEGSRVCLGRKFALVELCAFVTRIFSEYSVELVVDGVKAEANDQEKERAWKEVRKQAEDTLYSGVGFGVSVRLRDELPVTFVRRGEERFAGMSA